MPVITRRTFLKTATASLAATALPLYALAPLSIGISTSSYQSLSFAEMVAQLKILLPLNGLHNQQIEMSRNELLVSSRPSEDAVHAVRKQLDDAGIHSVSYYAGTLSSSDSLKSAINFAQILGAKNITAETQSGLLKEIDAGVSQAGLTFGIHNQFGDGFVSPEAIMKALDGLSPNCGATVDTGNFAASEHDPVEAVRLLGPRLKLVHLKDVKIAGSTENVLLGEGVAKISAVEEELHKQNFRRLVAVEYEKKGDVIEDMQKNVGYAWQYGFSGA